ncbi:MAG: hypothetical protein LBR66_03980 [Candidatus Symbiothrix sp.]|jgi:hypothetical protein|nr:hypothetical protein [Candidatus Symbiothrix sp.]
MKNFIFVLGVILAISASVKADDGVVRWNFNEEGVVPDGWSGAANADNISGGYLNITNAGWAFGPVYQTGAYTWRIYVPQLGVGEQFLALCNLGLTANEDLSYSIGIFYGTEANRAAASPAPTENQLLLRCYADVPEMLQVKAIDGGQEYTLELNVTLVDECYYVEWLLDGAVITAVQSNYTPEYTSFRMICGVMSNGGWQGSINCTQDYTAKWDYVQYAPQTQVSIAAPSDEQAVSVKYYNLQGVRISATRADALPSGIYLVKTTYASGKTVSEKRLVTK